MSRIRGKDTKPELVLRSLLHRAGYRFRLHVPDLPGKPDIVLPKYMVVILVNGCFWHRHEGCPDATMPKSRKKFWEDKFRRTVERDRRNKDQLEALGFKVLTVWECSLKKDAPKVLESLTKQLPKRTPP